MKLNVTVFPTMPEYREGQEAASKHEGFRDSCPYTFSKCNVDQFEFEREFRLKMNAWFHGWHAWIIHKRLNFKFEPIDS